MKKKGDEIYAAIQEAKRVKMEEEKAKVALTPILIKQDKSSVRTVRNSESDTLLKERADIEV